MLLWDSLFDYKRPALEEFKKTNTEVIEKAKKKARIQFKGEVWHPDYENTKKK